MGTFSKFHRYRDAGDLANVNNTERFGEPVKSLFTATKVVSLHHHIDITDENENIVYQSNSKMISLHDKTHITNAAGKEICFITRKVLSIHAKHTVNMADGTAFELSTELLHIVKSVTDINGLGWKLKGNIAGLNFELYDENDQVIAVVGKKMISLHEKTAIDIYMPEYEAHVVAILITFLHMLADRRQAVMSTSGS